jgi:hypothetical protein
MFYHCLRGQKKTSKSYKYKLKSIIKKTNQTNGQGNPIGIITIPQPKS